MAEGPFLVWGIPMFLNNKMNAFVKWISFRFKYSNTIS